MEPFAIYAPKKYTASGNMRFSAYATLLQWISLIINKFNSFYSWASRDLSKNNEIIEDFEFLRFYFDLLINYLLLESTC